MGIKSTEYLTRTQAESLLAELKSKLLEPNCMTDEELEDELERLNDIYFQNRHEMIRSWAQIR